MRKRSGRPTPNARRRWRATLAVLPLAAGCAVKAPDTLGTIDGHLAPCPSTANCVTSDLARGDATIAPLSFRGDAATAWRAAGAAARDIGGYIANQSDDYLHVTYTSTVFRFVDDLELRLDIAESAIQVRSASRVGRYDFGVNRRRVERLRAAFHRRLGSGAD
jgi:uncharacterized protein (DUF1499 family)